MEHRNAYESRILRNPVRVKLVDGYVTYNEINDRTIEVSGNTAGVPFVYKFKTGETIMVGPGVTGTGSLGGKADQFDVDAEGGPPIPPDAFPGFRSKVAYSISEFLTGRSEIIIALQTSAEIANYCSHQLADIIRKLFFGAALRRVSRQVIAS